MYKYRASNGKFHHGIDDIKNNIENLFSSYHAIPVCCHLIVGLQKTVLQIAATFVIHEHYLN